MDIIRDLGALGFASRLKRLAELLQRDVSRVYKTQKLDFEARWFPVMYSLSVQGSMSVTELATALGLTHPAINQIAGAMTKRGLLESYKDSADERRRILKLTAKGNSMVETMKPLWDEIALATGQLIDSADPNLLLSLSRIERSLSEKSMYDRVMTRLKLESHDEIEIVGYQPALRNKFRALNYEWLEESFEVEERDREVLSDPETHVLFTGGKLIFARQRGRVVGTAALVKHDRGDFELCKMAVTKSARRKGVGSRLLTSLIDEARKLGGKRIVLQTSPKLDLANKLYRQYGFRLTRRRPLWLGYYQRETIVMELKL